VKGSPGAELVYLQSLRSAESAMMSLSQRLENERLQRRETLRLEVRGRLRKALAEIAPGEPVIVFGSLTQPHRFHACSDVDLAFVEEPRACSIYRMQARLEEHLGHPVDVLVLSETRLREKIEREGERWTS
jgi:predicted nucleotidyltransferase